MTPPRTWVRPCLLWLALTATGRCGSGQEKLAPLDADEDIDTPLPSENGADAPVSVADAPPDSDGGAVSRDAPTLDGVTDRPPTLDATAAEAVGADGGDGPNGVRDAAIDSDASRNAADVAPDLPRGPALLSIAPTSYIFGDVLVGGGVTQNFVVTNRGGATTGALVLSLTGAAAGDYAIATVGNTCAAIMLTGGATCTAAVRLAPTKAGLKLAALSVSGGAGAMVTAQLVGAGIP